MQPDLEKYRPYLDRFDLSDERKAELIHTIWRIMEAFVDQAFGVHPAQQIGAEPSSGPARLPGCALELSHEQAARCLEPADRPGAGSAENGHE